MLNWKRALFAFAIVIAWGFEAAAENVRIASWNVREIFSEEDARARANELEKAANWLLPDVLLLQEIGSCGAAEAIRGLMRLDGYHVVCTDFSEDGHQHASFEVAVISRFPLANPVEFDPTPDGSTLVKEVPLNPAQGVKPVPTDRGFLWVDVPHLRLHVAVVHLKSSRGKTGKQDSNNAEQREVVVSAVAAKVPRPEFWPPPP